MYFLLKLIIAITSFFAIDSKFLHSEEAESNVTTNINATKPIKDINKDDTSNNDNIVKGDGQSDNNSLNKGANIIFAPKINVEVGTSKSVPNNDDKQPVPTDNAASNTAAGDQSNKPIDNVVVEQPNNPVVLPPKKPIKKKIIKKKKRPIVKTNDDQCEDTYEVESNAQAPMPFPEINCVNARSHDDNTKTACGVPIVIKKHKPKCKKLVPNNKKISKKIKKTISKKIPKNVCNKSNNVPHRVVYVIENEYYDIELPRKSQPESTKIMNSNFTPADTRPMKINDDNIKVNQSSDIKNNPAEQIKNDKNNKDGNINDSNKDSSPAVKTDQQDSSSTNSTTAPEQQKKAAINDKEEYDILMKQYGYVDDPDYLENDVINTRYNSIFANVTKSNN